MRFGIEASADVSARDVRLDDTGARFRLITPVGETDVSLPLPGRHNVRNALAATAISLAAGVPLDTIVAALGTAEAVAGRLVRHTLGNGAVLIDDSYNANPGSLNAAIDTLAAAKGERWLVLGDMRELGGDGAAMHAQAGVRAKSAGIARLYALGSLSAAAADAFGDGARRFDTHDALIEALRADLHGDARVLVKGSRGSAMDRVVTALRNNEGTGHAA